VRIGVLGAARIAPAALLKPARVVDGVEVAAVALRLLAPADPHVTAAAPVIHGQS
jgi:hypothetical protein